VAETVVRTMLMKMIEWKIGVDNRSSVSFGIGGKFMKKYITDDLYKELLKTYSNSEVEENWKSLFGMTTIFQRLSNEVAQKLNFQIDTSEQTNTMEYLKRKYDGQKKYR
jgi:aminoglycoside 6-adenylyltransferase